METFKVGEVVKRVKHDFHYTKRWCHYIVVCKVENLGSTELLLKDLHSHLPIPGSYDPDSFILVSSGEKEQISIIIEKINDELNG